MRDRIASASLRLAGVWLPGFLLLGVLVGMLGPLAVSWQYFIDVEPQLIGLHFLVFNAGYVVAVAAAQKTLTRVPGRRLALLSCGLASVSLAALALAAPPASAGWRLTALAAVGLAAGGLATALLHSLNACFAESSAAAMNRVGVFFGCGCLLSTMYIAATYYAGNVQLRTAGLAIFPLAFLVFFAARKGRAMPGRSRNREQDALRETLHDLRSVATVLFSLLLFFQFGNEWAIAGWLPLFLIHRLGSNPVFAMLLLGLYFLALMLGRLATLKLLPRVSHRKLLIGSMTVAVGGCLLLSSTGSLFGAAFAATVVGVGFAPIYPLIAEQLDHRFSYHPGFYNGIISIAITGAMSAPWLLGFVDAYFGIKYVMLLPALGSVVVLILALLIMLEAHLMGGDRAANLETVGIARRS